MLQARTAVNEVELSSALACRRGEHQGEFCRHDVGKTGRPGAAVLGYFLPPQKVTRSPKVSGIALWYKVTGSRLAPG